MGDVISIIEENDEMCVWKIKVADKWNVTWNKKSKDRIVGDWCNYIRK